VVPSWRFEQVIDAQFAEADGMESWCTQRQQARVKLALRTCGGGWWDTPGRGDAVR